MAGSPPDIDVLGSDALKKLVLRLVEENAALREQNAALREEIARLKGLKGRPKLKPSGMEKATAAAPKGGKRKQGRGPIAKRTIDEMRIVQVTPPPGSCFKGYEDFVVEDLIIRPLVVRYRRERWRTPDGKTLVAPLPAGVQGHFGPELRRFALMQYHQGQVTIGRLADQLAAIGLAISKRQLRRLLTDDKAAFLTEDRDVLRAGLETTPWISTDDTGARHKGRNGVCTQIGNDDFTWFATTGSKSRANFLGLLRGGHEDYVVNDAALAYMRRHHLAGSLIARLAEHPDRRFHDEPAWTDHLQQLGLSDLKVTPNPVRVASEGALWGSVMDHDFLRNAVILSDDAGQFNVGTHALCWIHAERLIHKLDTFNDIQRQAVEQTRDRVWRLYAALKAYRDMPSPRRKAELQRQFDAVFTARTGYASLNRLLRRLHANKNELLVVLDRPEIPLHTNGSENDIRCHVTKRKISGGTRSDHGRDCRDAFLGLMKTCQKLGVSFWSYLGSRLNVQDSETVPALPDLVRARAAPP
jgi:hypothetical protein